MSTTAERVQNGVAYFDDLVPNWMDKINLETLQMNLPHACILSQIHGGPFWVAMSEMKLLFSQCAEMGLCTRVFIWPSIVTEEYRELAEEWKKVITERRQQMVV